MNELLNKKKECLKNLITQFTKEISKLESVTKFARNSSQWDFTVTNEDVEVLDRRLSVMKKLFQPVLDSVNSVNNVELNDNLGIRKTDETIVKERNSRVDMMDDNTITTCLKKFQEDVNPFEQDDNKKLEKNAIMKHSLTDTWLCGFLAKLVSMIRDACGFKTSSKKLLEESKENINKLNLGS